MIRGTTSQFKFKIPYKFDELTNVMIKFWQPGNTNQNFPIVKTLQSCSRGKLITELFVSLTQTETLMFDDDKKGYVQLRARLLDGTVFASKQCKFTIYQAQDNSLFEPDDAPVDNNV